MKIFDILEEIIENFLMQREAFWYKIKYGPDRDTGVTEVMIKDVVKNKDCAWECGEETFGNKNYYKEL